jgi:hypothetical protein
MDYTTLDVVSETFKQITLYVVKTTIEAMETSKASKKDITNKVLALDIVKMA